MLVTQHGLYFYTNTFVSATMTLHAIVLIRS